MDFDTTATLPGAPPGAPAAAPLVSPGQSNATPTAAPSPAAAVTASQHGGLRGGRARADGLVPGSKEALEADRKYDAARHQKKRDLKRKEAQTDPPPIPPAGQTPAGGVAAVPGAAVAAGIPWDPKMLEPLFKQLVPTAEEIAVKQLTDKAVKAHLPGEIIHDIEKKAAWNPMAKQALEIAGAQVAAKWLTKSGISAEHQPEVVLGTALCSIFAGHVLLLKRMDELIREANPPATTPAKPQEKKP